MSTVTTLITAEEYARMPDTGRPTELVRGRIVEMNFPPPLHGYVCLNIGNTGWRYNEEQGRMTILLNNSGIVTERDPDTVRGPDVSFITYERIPKGQLPDFYLEDAVPDVVFEVLCGDDHWSNVLRKVAEYLNVGVQVACVVDPSEKTAQFFYADNPPSPKLSAGDELTFSEVLPGFSVRVGELFG